MQNNAQTSVDIFWIFKDAEEIMWFHKPNLLPRMEISSMASLTVLCKRSNDPQ